MDTTLIRIQCRDEVGLVSRISHVLAAHRLNITSMREFVDETAGLFFARIKCATDPGNTGPAGDPADENGLRLELLGTLPEGAAVFVNPPARKRIVVLVTKEYHCLGDLLVKNAFNALGAKVEAVIGNHADLEAFTSGFNIPFFHISKEGKSQEQFEEEMDRLIGEYEPDYLVLAKFMRILSPGLVEKYAQRIINIHHSFLPAFVGARPYKQAFERGVKLIGATAHFVTNDLDEGPIIAQQTISVNHNFSVRDMVVAGREIEKAVLNRALQLVFEDRVFISGNKTIVFE